MTAAPNVVTIGKILGPFGVQGEVRVESLSDVPDRFERLPSATLIMPSGESLVTNVLRARKSNRIYLVKFSAFSSPEEAAKFRGALVQVPQESLPPLPETQYYQFELIGLAVQDETGLRLGTIEDVILRPHQNLLVVRDHGEEHLIPAVHPIIQNVDRQAGIITVAAIEQWGIPHAM